MIQNNIMMQSAKNNNKIQDMLDARNGGKRN
jgi:hypothetical protein